MKEATLLNLSAGKERALPKPSCRMCEAEKPTKQILVWLKMYQMYPQLQLFVQKKAKQDPGKEKQEMCPSLKKIKNSLSC